MTHQDYIGRTETREDRLDPRLVEGLAATLGRPMPEGDIPPLWHWMLFQDWRVPGEVGPDGHPKRGGFLPPVHDLPRRMWAGGRLDFLANALRADDRVQRLSTIQAVSEKSGGSGRLVFVTVRHEITGPRGPVLSEEHDIVYRGTEGAAVRPAEAGPDFAADARLDLVPDPLLLFRYSALTGNGHRIHYDQSYVTQEEGYPGLIVHGPLQATLMAQTILDAAPGGSLTRFAFRG
ncbi:MAG: acyl-CoA dehydrogenase, partial [Rubritepida sp.]|nr:acyl-CoA dehydrogenase [Rubritepida sp.]